LTDIGFQANWRKHKPALVKERELKIHGLRKTAVCRLLEAGCTDAQVGAVTGQSREMISHYAERVNQKTLASDAMALWQNGTKTEL